MLYPNCVHEFVILCAIIWIGPGLWCLVKIDKNYVCKSCRTTLQLQENADNLFENFYHCAYCIFSFMTYRDLKSHVRYNHTELFKYRDNKPKRGTKKQQKIPIKHFFF